MTIDITPEAVENLWRYWANKAQALADENKALSAALSAAKAETAAAYEAGLAGTHLRLSIARKIGMYGCAYDGPYDARAYTYEHLPGNQDAYGIGKAASNASKDRAGDHIDVGLSLLRHMNDAGFGVFALNKHDTLHALTEARVETAAAYEAAASHVAHRFGTVTVPEAIRVLTPADSKAALDRMIAEARKPYEEAYQYALNLADCVMGKHYHDNKDWRPEGDLMGLLTQIDNMVAGVASKARSDGMREAAAIADSKYANGEMGNPGHHILAAIPKGKDHE